MQEFNGMNQGAKDKQKSQIPLRTSSKVTARERLQKSIKLKMTLKQGMEFSFPLVI